MKIYYIDSDIVVCEKPYGVSSQQSGGENMVELLANELVECVRETINLI